MKLLIASDIHGSAYYCEKLINAIKEEKPDKLILLGDILYHGPRNDLPKGYFPKKVIEMLNPLKDIILCNRGNCDAEVDQMVLEFPIMADYNCLDINNRKMYFTHGHVYNDKKLPPVNKGDVVVLGHTHIPRCEIVNDVLIVNPGSVSIPKEDSQNSYIIYEDNRFIWMNIDGKEYKNYSI